LLAPESIKLRISSGPIRAVSRAAGLFMRSSRSY
jgi:hypothetical protein